MRILILGAGQVGETLARNLVSEHNDIVIVDKDAARLSDIRSHIDIQTISGHAANLSVLLQAGIEQTDLVVAVTSEDEVNIVACLIANKVFQITKTIARIHNSDYQKYPELFQKHIMPIQTIIYPAEAIIQHIQHMIRYSDFSHILNFCNNLISMVTFDIQPDDYWSGKTLAALRHSLTDTDTSLIAIFNKKNPLPLDEQYVLNDKDKLIFVAFEKNLNSLLLLLKRMPKAHHRIMIAGGGIIGGGLAQCLENQYQIKLIDRSSNLVEKNASELNKTLVIEGDISDRELLINENIEDIDVFCAVTNHDETNIMASLQAKYLGVKYAMALVNHENYLELIEDSVIDASLSPQSITIGSILSQIRHSSVVKIHSLQTEEVEAIELKIEGTEQTSAIIGRPISEIEFPPQCIVAGILRGQRLYFSQSNLVLASGDHLILLLLEKQYIHQLEALFEINLTFMS